VLLLDEPLSALDAKVRVQLRDEIKRIQSSVGTTTLFVTHDQEEALAVADRVGVMRAGKLEQLASPSDVYQRPASAFVADFVGVSNRLPGAVAASGDTITVLGTSLPLVSPAAAGPATALVRPEAVSVTPAEDGTGRVLTCSFLGPTSRVTVTVGETLVVAQVASGLVPALTPGTAVDVTLAPVPVALDL
jgi:putative spermidine/putrescine transport system ATP-binding protein